MVFFLLTLPAQAETPTIEKQPEPVLTTEQTIKKEFADIPILIDIAKCESEFRQFDTNGNVLRGVANAQDVGAFQVNEKYHLEDSKKLGIDIYTLEGNMQYARYLYGRQGSKPWKWSQHCWGSDREVVV